MSHGKALSQIITEILKKKRYNILASIIWGLLLLCLTYGRPSSQKV